MSTDNPGFTQGEPTPTNPTPAYGAPQPLHTAPQPQYGAPTPPASYGAYSPTPGYGQSGPAPMPTPDYGQTLPPAPVYGQAQPAQPLPTDYPVVDAAVHYSGAPSAARLMLASWPKRFLGGLVDWGPVIVLAALAGYLNFIGVSPMVFDLLWSVNALWGIINIGYLGGSTGVSLGRRLARTKLVGEETLRPLGPALGIGRYFLHAIDSAICWVGFLFPLWTNKKQTIADMIVKSIVIEDNH